MWTASFGSATRRARRRALLAGVVVSLIASGCSATLPFQNNASTPGADARPPSWHTGAAGQVAGSLHGIACPTPDQYWAGGAIEIGGAGRPLMEPYAAGTWSVANTPAIPDGMFFGVACSGPGDCWAVGRVAAANGPQPLIEHYTGTGWSVVATPSTAGWLSSVGCPGTNDYWAVGIGARDSRQLTGVTCATATRCWAVGSHWGPSTQPLIEQSLRGGWATADSPSLPGGGHTELSAVTCPSTTCWAVGTRNSGSRTLAAAPLIESTSVRAAGP
jgi:hypothetical protein